MGDFLELHGREPSPRTHHENLAGIGDEEVGLGRGGKEPMSASRRQYRLLSCACLPVEREVPDHVGSLLLTKLSGKEQNAHPRLRTENYLRHSSWYTSVVSISTDRVQKKRVTGWELASVSRQQQACTSGKR